MIEEKSEENWGMQLWLLTVFGLFALVQTFQWVKGVILPFPLYVIAGAFLAIASNYEKGLGAMGKGDRPSPVSEVQTATLIDDRPLLTDEDHSPR